MAYNDEDIKSLRAQTGFRMNVDAAVEQGFSIVQEPTRIPNVQNLRQRNNESNKELQARIVSNGEAPEFFSKRIHRLDLHAPTPVKKKD